MSLPSNTGQKGHEMAPKHGQIYDHKGAMSTTNWHLPRALPMTEQQRRLEIEPHAAIVVDLQQPRRVRHSVLQGI